MKIEIETKKDDEGPMVREFIHRKVRSGLDRFAARVSRVVVSIQDESRNSVAFDGLCQIDAFLIPSGQLHVSSNGESVFDSVLQAARKMEHAIKHDIDRGRRSPRIRNEKSKRKFVSALTPDESTSIDESQDHQEN